MSTPLLSLPRLACSALTARRARTPLAASPLAAWPLALALLAAVAFAPEAAAQRVPEGGTRQYPVSTEEALRLSALTIDDGLSQNAVSAVVQGPRGFLWVGTKDGLNRYDGYEFVVYTHDPADPHSLPDDHITALLANEDGTLWVGTATQGVARFDPVTGRATRYGGIPRSWVMALAVDREGALWAGTDEAGLYRLPPEAPPGAELEAFVYDPAQPRDPATINSYGVASLDVGADGTLWIGGWGALSRRRPGGPFEHYATLPSTGDAIDRVAVREDARGRVWVGTGWGLWRVDAGAPPDGTGRDPFAPTPVASPGSETYDLNHIATAPDGRVWSFERDHLAVYDPSSGAVREIRPAPRDALAEGFHHVKDLLWDRSGVLWLATNCYGLGRHDTKASRF